jgi:uncharacterized protein with ATP-grasp and redox domains
MKSSKKQIPISEIVKVSWFILVAFTGIIYWAAKQDSSINDVKEHKIKIASLENRITVLENGLDKIQVKIDDIKDDLSLIKTAVLKKS